MKNSMNICCGTCIFHRKFEDQWRCCCSDGDYYGLETEYDDGVDCMDYEDRR